MSDFSERLRFSFLRVIPFAPSADACYIEMQDALSGRRPFPSAFEKPAESFLELRIVNR